MLFRSRQAAALPSKVEVPFFASNEAEEEREAEVKKEVKDVSWSMYKLPLDGQGWRGPRFALASVRAPWFAGWERYVPPER